MGIDQESLGSISLKIRNARKTLGISQKRLARLAGLSQSTIARLESDIERLNPSYKAVFEVMDALDRLGNENERDEPLNKKSEDIMHRDIVSVEPTDTLEKAIKIIKNYDFPQIPVLNSKRNVVGTVSQRRILSLATERPEGVSKILIKEIIEASLPQVDKKTPIAKLKSVLENFNAVVVVEDSRAIGIITIYDILKLL